MLATLHRLVAFYTARATYRRMGQRHWYAGCGWPANDDPMFELPTPPKRGRVAAPDLRKAGRGHVSNTQHSAIWGE